MKAAQWAAQPGTVSRKPETQHKGVHIGGSISALIHLRQPKGWAQKDGSGIVRLHSSCKTGIQFHGGTLLCLSHPRSGSSLASSSPQSRLDGECTNSTTRRPPTRQIRRHRRQHPLPLRPPLRPTRAIRDSRRRLAPSAVFRSLDLGPRSMAPILTASKSVVAIPSTWISTPRLGSSPSAISSLLYLAAALPPSGTGTARCGRATSRSAPTSTSSRTQSITHAVTQPANLAVFSRVIAGSSLISAVAISRSSRSLLAGRMTRSTHSSPSTRRR